MWGKEGWKTKLKNEKKPTIIRNLKTSKLKVEKYLGVELRI
jgi:hypothetical protein